MSELNAEFFKEKVNAQELRGLLIVQLGMVFGPIMFALAIFVIHFTSEAPKEPPNADFLMVLSAGNAILALTAYFAASILGKLLLGGRHLDEVFKNEGEKAVSVFFTKFRGVRILQLALFEGPALFGLVVCLLASFEGVLHHQPALWANLTTMVIAVLSGLATLPNANTVANVFQQKLEMQALAR